MALAGVGGDLWQRDGGGEGTLQLGKSPPPIGQTHFQNPQSFIWVSSAVPRTYK